MAGFALYNILVSPLASDVPKELDYDSFHFACFRDLMGLLLCGCLKAVAKAKQGKTLAEAGGEGHVTAQ